MRKLVVSIGVLSLFIVLFWSLTKSVSGYHQARVLGDNNLSVTPQIPPTADGPGLILPDSPFFFLDKIKQAIRLFFAFTPEAKAKIRVSIAGERLSELRFMLARNQERGIKDSLEEVSDNLQKATDEFNRARLSGRNVSNLAKSINITIKEKQEALDVLEHLTKGELKVRVKVSQEILKEAKLEVEDALPEDELENEIEDDLKEDIEDNVKEASDSAKGLEHAIDVLSNLASQAAQKQQARREEALRHAIEVKNEALRKQEEKQLELEKKKQEKLLKAQEKAIEKAREAVAKAQEATQKFKEAQEKVNEIKNTSGSSGSGSSDGESHDSGSRGGDGGDKSGKD